MTPRLLFQLVEEAPVALSVTDKAAGILYANRAFEAVTGYPREEVIGANESILSNKATPGSIYKAMWEALREHQTWTGTLVNRTRDGEAYLAELTVSPVQDAAGEVTHYLGMHRDVTEVHTLQRQVEHQKGLLETILDTAPVVVALLSPRQRVLIDNQEYKKLMGDLRGDEPAERLLAAVAQQSTVELPEPGVRGRGFRNVEVRLDLANGDARWFDCSTIWLDYPETSADGYFKTEQASACLLLATETTRLRREHERARLEHLRATLSEQQRVRGMREALAAATFQIQQPLNLIKAATAMLQRRGEEGERLLQVLEEIGENAQHAFDTLNAALPSTELEPLQPINLNEVAREVLEMFSDDLLRIGADLLWRPSPVLSPFMGRPKEVRGLLMNLVDNAMIALTEARQEHRELELRTEQDRELLLVTVRDNGPGIPRADRVAVFQPLHCGWRHKGGHAGMGLAMAQEIAAWHGGGIQIDDDDGRGGCRVRVEFPLPR
jgi:nitrogen fixation negative regulator NifL